jgi:hypothetical protein
MAQDLIRLKKRGFRVQNTLYDVASDVYQGLPQLHDEHADIIAAAPGTRELHQPAARRVRALAPAAPHCRRRNLGTDVG